MKTLPCLITLLVLDFRSHASPTGCQSDEWRCTDGSCISLNGRCDNFPDCVDGSDELQCTISPVCLEGLESCPQPNGTTVCVKKAVGCNCGPVKAIANGKIDSNNITIGSVATVVCDAGYDATLPTVTCQVTGLWETVSCIPKNCGSTPSISFGNITLSDDKNSTLGATAKVTCDNGYLENKHFIICQSSGLWENAECIPIDCGPVQSIAFGKVVLDDSNSTTFGASAGVICDAGYITNTSKVLCLKSGLWEPAECTIRGCGYVPAISHGTIKTPANDSVGSFASVACDKGYDANVSSVTCQISGQWESASCTIKDCGQTPVIPFGQITPNGITTYGSSANVTCYTGYTSNVSNVLCQSSGVWEESACKPIDCGFAPSLSFGNITLSDNKNSTFGATAEVTCDIGYLENKQFILCQSSGVWENAACLPIDCGLPPVITYGRTSFGNDNITTFGATALVSCHDNYVATMSSIKCQYSGLWENATCVLKGCGSLPKISHGTIRAAANVSVGSVASVVCDTGYEANVSSVMCRSSGLWETAMCTVKDCGQPPVITFGQSSPVDYRNTSYGASASVTCFRGYESNVSRILCQSTGVWQTAVCRPKNCGSPPAIAFGNTSLNYDGNTTFGAMAYVTCDYNFATSTPVITCQSTRKWENAFCLHKGCKSRLVINNGAISAVGNATVGSYATVTCDKGYEPSTTKVICKTSGTWEGASCKPKDCGPVPVVANGNITLVSNKSTYQEEAFVTCYANYVANVSRITCQSTGVWEAASCISESKHSYDTCTKEHGICTQHFYENIRLRGLKSTKCKTFCQCAHASTLPTGNVTYKWVEHNCPPGTLFDDSLPSPVCNHAFLVLC